MLLVGGMDGSSDVMEVKSRHVPSLLSTSPIREDRSIIIDGELSCDSFISILTVQ